MNRTLLVNVAAPLLTATVALAYMPGCQDKTSQQPSPQPSVMPPAPSTPKEPSYVIILNDTAYPCRIIKRDEKVWMIELIETREVVTVEWIESPRTERPFSGDPRGQWKILNRQPLPPPLGR